MKSYFQYIIPLFVVLCVAASCKKDDPAMKGIAANNKLRQHNITGVNGPTSGNVNEELVFAMVWNNADSTRKFDHLQDSAFHNTRIIRLYSSTTGGDTTMLDKDNNTVLYKFKSATPGVFYLKFYTTDNKDKSAIIDTILINK